MKLLSVALILTCVLFFRSATMSRGFDKVGNVNDSKELWKLGVRIEDIWTVNNRGKEHIEFIILDKQVRSSSFGCYHFFRRPLSLNHLFMNIKYQHLLVFLIFIGGPDPGSFAY
jgi:hypothetical protein